MACSEYEPLIEKHKSGTLTEEEKARLEDHVKDCFECRTLRDGGILPERGRVRERVKKNKSKSLPVLILAILIVVLVIIIINAVRNKGPEKNVTTGGPAETFFIIEALRVPGVKAWDPIKFHPPGYNIPPDGQIIFAVGNSGVRITAYSNSSLVFEQLTHKYRVMLGQGRFDFKNLSFLNIRIEAGGEIKVGNSVTNFNILVGDTVTTRVFLGDVTITSGGETLELKAGQAGEFTPGKPPVLSEKKSAGQRGRR